MGKVRIELVCDFGPRKGQVLAGIVVECNYDSVLKAAQNKLQLKKKEMDQVTLRCVDVAGARVLQKGDLSDILYNGAKILVCHDALEAVGEVAPLKFSKKAQNSVDQLSLVAAGLGSLSARGRPNLETLAALQQCKGITGVVTLLLYDEALGADRHVGEACERLGLKWCHAPLAGPKAMGIAGAGKVSLSPEDLESFRKVRQIRQWLENSDEKLVVHCAAGLHRTGLFLFVLLRELGESPEGALDKIRQMRQETFTEFQRLRFQDKAESIFALVRSGGQGNPLGTVAEVEVVAERAAVLEDEEEEKDDDIEECPEACEHSAGQSPT